MARQPKSRKPKERQKHCDAQDPTTGAICVLKLHPGKDHMGLLKQDRKHEIKRVYWK